MTNDRDQSFCSNSDECATDGCDRKLTPEVEDAATLWWGNPGAPIATMPMRETCGKFTEKVK